MINLSERAARPDEEVAGGFIGLSIGGERRSLPVLVIGANRAWKASFEAAIRDVLGGIGELESIDAVVGVLNGSTDVMLDLLVGYDRSEALGGRAWLEGHATDADIYEALKRVTAAAYPFGLDLAKMVPDLRTLLLTAVFRMQAPSSRPTSVPPPSTVGRRRKSRRS